ncbi:MAG: adenylate kinase [Proteobacteria bacterium]|nr:adenylate kinase [Pseudomonadota bacterium]
MADKQSIFDGVKRIAIIGYSSSGKTTLANALSRKLDVPHYSLDKIHHLPGWTPRPFEEFAREHDSLIEENAWVMEGNYSKTMPQRFARADMIIYMDFNRMGCAVRCLKRWWQWRGQQRPDAPEGCYEAFPAELLRYILFASAKRKPVWQKLIVENAHKPIIRLTRFSELKEFYKRHEVSR